MQLLDLFDLSLQGRRNQPALEYERADGELVALTFGDLDARSNRMARALEGRGVRAGDRIALYLPNGVEFIDVFLACVRLGVIVVPMNILYREREIVHIVDDAEPVAVVVHDEEARQRFPGNAVVWEVEALARDARREAAGTVRRVIDGDAAAAIVATSGTTGRSKGAVLSHNNFLANAASLATCWRITSDDRYLAVLPLFHVHGLGNGLVTWLVTGCRMRLAERFDIGRAASLFESFQPTLFFGVPTIYVRLLELPTAVAQRIGAGMRLFVCGSAPLSAATLESFQARFGHVILERYGMSETLMNLSNPYVGERRPGSVGFPLPGVSTRIQRHDGGEAATDEVGELLVRGPNVIRHYWRRADADAEAFVDGWFRTGDLARRSADGYYTLAGRRSDLIISGGYNIYPREIEELLLECRGIREAAVVGVPDPRRGEVPVAYVVADDEASVAALEERCRAQLASFKLPRAFVRVEALPRTALGKVQKHALPPWSPSAGDTPVLAPPVPPP
jgi:malonyl-CoA/methylmalonyl-CoA synthetase